MTAGARKASPIVRYQKLYLPFLRYFRSKRMRTVANLLPDELQGLILDVGGTWYNWSLLKRDVNVVAINLYDQNSQGLPSGFRVLCADGRRLPFKDQSFDLVFCNSVIEHLGTFGNQQQLASEIRRVGRSYFVQTPNRWFFLEPHYFTPFIHYLPVGIRRRFLRNLTLWGRVTRPSKSKVEEMLSELRLLTTAEMHSLFPEADHHTEHFLGLRKSLLAVKRRPD